MSESSRTDTYAAVDLGSNSFHLLVTRREHGELRVIDRIKEMVDEANDGTEVRSVSTYYNLTFIEKI